MSIYRSFAHSTKGAKYVKKNPDFICQDSSDNYDHYEDEKLAIAIVSDGHGSSQYFRSDTGSRLAVKHAMENIKIFVEAKPFADKDNSNEEVAEDISNAEIHDKLCRLAGSIVNIWQKAVEENEKGNPLKDDEKIMSLEDKYKNRYLNIYKNPEKPELKYIHQVYGTTLIASAMTENYWFGLHIGDGKCQVLLENGEWAQPVPWDKRCFLTTTTSICDDDALLGFRYWFGYRSSDGNVMEFIYGPDSGGIDTEKRSGVKPVAIFVGTDGVDDTYPIHENEKYLRNIYRLMLLSLAKDGFDGAQNQIKSFIEKLANQGSQDDVSLAGIVLEKLPDELIEILKLQDDAYKANEQTIAEQKKLETQKQALQNEKTKDEQLKKQESDLRKKKQSIEENLEEIKSKLKLIEEEKNNQQQKVSAAEEEYSKSENTVSKMKEQSGALEIKLKSAMAQISSSINSGSINEIIQHGQEKMKGILQGVSSVAKDAAKVVSSVADDLSETYDDIKEMFTNPKDNDN
jgi:hypothetical protein